MAGTEEWYRGAAEQKNGRTAISAILVSVMKKSLVHLIRCGQMLPVLGREVVEGQQRVAILAQALDRLVVFDAPGLDEGVERHERILLGLGHPDLLQRPLGFRLLALR